MDNKELRKKLAEAKAQLIGLCNDHHNAKVLISKMLSLKGQLGIKPASVFVPEDIESEIKQSAYHIFRTKSYTSIDKDGNEVPILGSIVFKVRGLAIVISPTLNAYYFPFNTLLEAHNHYNELDEEIKEKYQIVLDHTIVLCQLISYVFSDDKLLNDVLPIVIQYLNGKIEESEKEENLPIDNEQANEDFKESFSALEDLKQELGRDVKNN